MYIEQLYTNCLAEAAYYIESEKQAIIIDPLRETQPYLEKLQERGATLKYIFETHFHADFVSGHLDLSKATGAPIVFGPNAETAFPIHQAEDAEFFEIGKLKIKVLHTPGHTMESTTYLLFDEQGKEHAIFTGDTLFIGDVGRPDLAQKSDEMTSESMAATLYDSLRQKILPLPDDVLVYPAHGAGSACGKNMSKETFDTLGHQKMVNYALQETLSKEDFVKELTSGISPAPQYFAKNAALNKSGYDNVNEVIERGSKALTVEAFLNAREEGALVLDTRHQNDFEKGFIPGSLFIGLDGSFAVWVGTLIEKLDQAILIIAPKGREGEAAKRLARVGYDNSLGYLDGGIESWEKAGHDLDHLHSVDVEWLENNWEAVSNKIVDSRKPSEFEAGHVDGAQLIPLDFIFSEAENLDPQREHFVHCRSGYRSVIACSILKKMGFSKLHNVYGGYLAMAEGKLPISASV